MDVRSVQEHGRFSRVGLGSPVSAGELYPIVESGTLAAHWTVRRNARRWTATMDPIVGEHGWRRGFSPAGKVNRKKIEING